MKVSISNRGSYGGELAVIVDPSPDFLEDSSANGLGIRFMGNDLARVWFSVIHISRIRNRRFSQELIDLVEIDGDYDIDYDVKYCAPEKVSQVRYSRKK